LRDIDACLSRSAVDVELLSRHKRKANATLPAWMRRIGSVLAAAALCSAAAGCAGDAGVATSGKSDGSGQMRYYGGPKSPMWRGPVEN
jgi:anti-sigma factor RsiW